MNPNSTKPPRFALDPFLVRRTLLRPPQYGLGALLAIVSFCCLFFAAFKFIGASGGAALVLLALAILAHVLGTSIGSRLRELGDEGRQRELPQGARPRGKRLAVWNPSPPTVVPGETALSEQSPSRAMSAVLALRSLLLVVAGLVLGYWISAAWFVYWDWATITAALSACGLIASAIGFWVSTSSS